MIQHQENKAFTIYNASAGSGKTFTLVRDYLTILFQSKSNDSFRKVLAITFTNKAVAEMKSRIVDNLIAFSKEQVPNDSLDMLNAVKERTELSTDDVRDKAKRILKTLIHNYAAFEVSTIDGFTHRVLRTFSRDLGLSGNFEVSMQVEELLIEAVDRVIAKAGEDALLTKTLIDFVIAQADDDKSWDISTKLYAIAKLIINENNLQHLAALQHKSLEDFNRFSKEIYDEQKALIKKTVLIAESVFTVLEDAGINPKDAFTGKYGFKYFTKLKNKHYKDVSFNAAWQTHLSDQTKPMYSKSSKDLSNDQKTTLDALLPDISNLFDRSKHYVLELHFLDQVSKNVTALSLLNTIKVELDTIKKERSLVLISDFNKTISDSIKDQPAPFIYERLGERYRHFFIDEFQDTSTLQWQNLIPLIDNALSSLDDSGKQGSLLLVGDAKQSIYRWRGGKAEQFIDLYSGASPFHVKTHVENLPNNYRSAVEIVNFNNALFKHLAKHFKVDDYEKLYAAARQEVITCKTGYVNINFIEASKKEEEHDIFPERVLEIIESCTRLNYSKKDICILTRGRKEGIVIADYLSAKGISIISSETLLIANSPEVNCVLNVLELIENPLDNLKKVEILHYVLDKRAELDSVTTILQSFLEKSNASFYKDLKEFEIIFNPSTVRALPLYDAVAYIIQAFQLEPDSNAYVQYFLDFVFNYASQHLGGIKGFLKHWQQHKDKLSILVPEGQDAVQLLTIHRSKGLEFPIVIYPYANDDFTDFRRDSLWIDLPESLSTIPKAYISASKDLLDLREEASLPFQKIAHEKHVDAINVLYVALTRAKEKLYILGNKEITKGVPKTNKISGLLIDFLQQQQLWNDDESMYEFGNNEPKASFSKDKSPNAYPHKKFEIASFDERAITLATNSGRLWGTTLAEALDEGVLIHDIMAKINSVNDVETVLQSFKASGRLSSLMEEDITQKIWRIVKHKDLVPYFTHTANNLNERDIVGDKGEILRPDRVNILNGNQAVIIDYKTGLFNERHKDQILDYAQAYTKMGYNVIKQILIYTNNELDVKNV